MRRILLAAAMSAAAVALGSCGNPLNPQPDAGLGADVNWTAPQGGADEAGYSRLAEVTPANAGKLGLAWSLDLPEEVTLESTPLHVDGTPWLTVAAIRGRARRFIRNHKGDRLPLVIVDHLGLIRPDDASRHFNETGQTTEISKALKAMAKQLACPVIALSQLSRRCEERPDKRPNLSDLRQSGSIEQDADVVIFVYREEYYLERERPESDDPRLAAWEAEVGPKRGRAHLIVAKQRNGPVGSVELHYNSQTTGFHDHRNDVGREDSAGRLL